MRHHTRRTRLLVPLIVAAGLVAGMTPTAVPAQQLRTLLQNMLQNALPSSGSRPPGSAPPAAAYPPGSRQQSYTQYPPPPPDHPDVPTRSRPASPAAPAGQVAADAQRMLDDLGYDAGVADGAWGGRSDQALRAFQRDHGRVADGALTATAMRAVRDAWTRRAPLQAGAGAPPSPSFSCARAGSAAELTICRQPDLASLDQQLAQAYADAKSASPDGAAALLARQHLWRGRRDACGSDGSCLRRAMTDRIAELRAPTAIAAVGAPAGTGPAPLASGGPAAGDPLASLTHPPAGLRPWDLEVIEGRLAVADVDHSPHLASSEFAQGANFFRLLLDGNVPDGAKNEADQWFLAGLFTEQAARPLFGTGWQWAGNNEIERARVRRAFVASYAPLLVEMAPKLPLVLHWTETAHLGDYDLDRGGFPVQTLGGSAVRSQERLKLVSSLEQGGLRAAPGFGLPDLFWPVDQDTADGILRKWPDRFLKLFAVVELGPIDPAVKETSLRLDRLALYTPDHATKLHDYPVAPAAAGAAPAPDRTAVAASGAAGDAGADRDAVSVARQWNLPVLQGLPWIDHQQWNLDLSSPFGFDGDFGFNAATGLRPLALSERWTRAILALTLAALPESAAISDPEALGASCILLPPAEQVRLLQRRTCGSELLKPDNEFAAKDVAAAFRARALPRIRAAAPRLPFQLLLALPIEVGKYDAARAGFTLQAHEAPPLRLFGVPLDVKLPEFWPATEAQARSYLAAKANAIGFGAWLGLKITVASVTPGQVGPGAPATGLPGNAVLRLRAEQVALYQDAGLRTLLQDFTKQAPRLPQPILGTAEETAPPPVSSMPVTPETALMALLHAGAPPDLAIDWSNAAALRRQSEDSYRFSDTWHDVDPWGVFFPSGSGATMTDAYRQWTLRRSAALPGMVTLSRLVPPYPITGALPVLTTTRLNGFTAFGSNGGVGGSGTLARQLLARGIDPMHLLGSSFYLAGNQRVNVVLAFPQAPGAYGADLGPALAAPVPDAPQASVVVTAKLDGLEVLPPPDQYSYTMVVLRLRPDGVAVRRGSETLATLPLTGPDWPPPPPPATAEQRLAGPPYGPDVLGIRLGMKIVDAEALVRSALHVTRVVETAPQPAQVGTVTLLRQVLRGRLFLDDATRQAIALFDAPRDADGRVVAMWRTAPVPVGAWDSLLQRLTAKYGQPSRSQTREAVWTNRFVSQATTGDCAKGVADGQFAWHNRDRTDEPGGFSGWIGDFPTTPDVALHLEAFAGCGPALRVRNPLHAPDDPTAPLEMQLFDLGVLAGLSHPAQPAPAPTVPIRF